MRLSKGKRSLSNLTPTKATLDLSILWLMLSFLSSNVIGPKEQSHILVRTPSLPTELLLLILSYLNNKRDLAVLSLTCQRFRSILEPRLYSRIDIRFSNITVPDTPMEEETSLNGSRWVALCRTLISPHYSSLVTSITFVSPICNRNIISEFQEWWTRLSDKCDKIDGQLSNILQALPNLYTLLIECRACWSPNPERRHRYLQNLKTRTLTNLSFKCSCSPEPLSQTYKTLSSRCCQAIQSLEWERTSSQQAQGEEQEFDVSEILTSLQKLSYIENDILDKFLSCRAITHLGCGTWDDTRYTAFCKGPSNGVLTWLCTTRETREFDGDGLGHLLISRRYLATRVIISPKAFENVTHLGGFFFFLSNPSDIVEQMKPFSSLPKLASIDVLDHIPSFYEDPWKVDLLNDLGTQHPNLRLVYIKGLKAFDPLTMFIVCIVWQRSNNTGWTGRQVKDYDTILNTWNEID